MLTPKTFQQRQLERALEESKIKVGNRFVKSLADYLIKWVDKARSPEYRGMVLFLSKNGSLGIWSMHRSIIEHHVMDLYEKAIHPLHKGLTIDHSIYIDNAARIAASEVWSIYHREDQQW
jgi:hypothetical protein